MEHTHQAVVHVAHHIRGRNARTRFTGSPQHLDALAQHLKTYSNVQAIRRTSRSLIVYHQGTLLDLIGKIEAEGIADVLHLPSGSSNFLEQLGPGVLTTLAGAIVIWFFL